MAFAILLLLVGVFVVINTLNGNLPGIVLGDTSFNDPTTSKTATSTNNFAGNGPLDFSNVAKDLSKLVQGAGQSVKGIGSEPLGGRKS